MVVEEVPADGAGAGEGGMKTILEEPGSIYRLDVWKSGDDHLGIIVHGHQTRISDEHRTEAYEVAGISLGRNGVEILANHLKEWLDEED